MAKLQKMQFGVYLKMTTEIFKVVQTSHLFICCPFHVLLMRGGAPKIIFPVLISNPDLCELSLCVWRPRKLSLLALLVLPCL